MSTPRMRRVTSVLVAALREPESQRNDFVRNACGEDEEMAYEVLDLLQHQDVSESAVPSSVSAEQLLERIQQSELFTADEIARFGQQIDDAQRPSSGSQLALHLLREGKLTPFQVSVLVDDTRDPLVLASYEILDHIADGGMGRVYKARHRLMHRTVAIKLLTKNAVDSPNAARRFRREVQLAAQLNHENIVQAFDAAEVDGQHLLAMEYVDGVDLSRIVRRVGPLPAAQAVDYILQAARGLAYAHRCGVIHRDVKPSNMLVDRKDTVKILDLGLARVDAPRSDTSATQEDLTRDNLFFGTLNYLAPEQATDPKTADQRADIYSLGCTLFYLLTGRPVYEAETPAAKIVAHREDPIPSLCDVCNGVFLEFEELFTAMLAKNPEDRVQSMDDVVTRLESIVQQLPTEERRIDWRERTSNDADFLSPTRQTSSHTTATFQMTSTDAQAVASTRDGTIPKATTAPHRIKLPWMIAAALMIVVGTALTVLVIQLTTSIGTIVVTLDDADASNVVVHVDNQKIDVKTLDDGKAIAITVDPGKRRLQLQTSDGLRYFAKEIEVERNGTRFLAAKLVTKKSTTKQSGRDGPHKVASTRPDGNDERSIALWLFGFDAVLRVTVDRSSEQELRADDPLPDQPFHVVAVNIDNRDDFTNESVKQLRSLPHLYDVWLNRVAIDDECISTFAAMPNLGSLHLGYAGITGRNLAELNDLQLDNVSLSGNPIEIVNIASMQDISSLQSLGLQGVNLDDEGLSYLSRAAGLISLDVNNNPINGNGIAYLSNAKKLTRLSIWNTILDDAGMTTIANTLSTLQILNAGGTRITDDALASLSRTPDLTKLTLEENLQLTDRGVENLIGLTKLQWLTLSGTSISDDAITYVASFPKIQILFVEHTRVSDRSINTLLRIGGLKELGIRNTAISKDGFLRLKRGLPDCQIYWMQSESNSHAPNFDRERALAELVTGRNQSVWIELANSPMVAIDIKDPEKLPDEPFYVLSADFSHSEQTTDSSLARFRGMPKLKDLHLAQTPVGDVGMTHIATMKALLQLTLDGTRVTSAGLRHLSELPNLQSIGVEHIALQDEDLQLMPSSIRTLYIGYTGITKLTAIDHLDKLVNVSLAGLQLDDGELRRVIVTGRFAQVKTMHLADSNVSDADVDQLSTLSQLEHLNIYNTHITQAGYDRLKQALPNCEFEWK